MVDIKTKLWEKLHLSNSLRPKLISNKQSNYLFLSMYICMLNINSIQENV